MKSNPNSNDNFQEKVDIKGKPISTGNLNYLYPNGHRMTHQMRWFKHSSGRGFRLDIAA